MTIFSIKPEDLCSVLPELLTKAYSVTNLYIKHVNIYISRSSSFLSSKQTHKICSSIYKLNIGQRQLSWQQVIYFH